MMRTRLFLVIAAHLSWLGLANAQEKDTWVGRPVFTKDGTVLKVGNKVVDDEGRSASLAASGKERRWPRLYLVEKINGDWLWLKDQASGIAGWVDAKSVIPYDQAIDYYTNEIRSKPTALSSNNRGVVRVFRGEPDDAIKDFNEAIRLDPKNATYWNGRASAWYLKPDYERVIRDCEEAIRLDPKYASAYACRGRVYFDISWSTKGQVDYDTAIADFDKAIELDPKDIISRIWRSRAWSLKKDFAKAISGYEEATRVNPNDHTSFREVARLLAAGPDAKFRDGKKAVVAATRAGELTGWQNPIDFVLLAAAHAEVGDFEKAVESQEKAIKFFSDGEDKKAAETRLELYKEKKPYRASDAELSEWYL